jgi:hypothetical protein
MRPPTSVDLGSILYSLHPKILLVLAYVASAFVTELPTKQSLEVAARERR